MKNILIAIVFLILSTKINAQSDTLSLTQKVDASKLVFEGLIISDSSFWNINKTYILTIKYVLVTKQFKGHFTSDTVKVVIRESHHTVDGITQEITDGGNFSLFLGIEGIFFCKPVDRHLFVGIEAKDVYQINQHYRCDGFILITCKTAVPPYSHRAFSCEGTFFDNVEKELYEPIEKITGEKYRQLRLNCLEQNKQRK
jgi:hypothetical protein